MKNKEYGIMYLLTYYTAILFFGTFYKKQFLQPLYPKVTFAPSL